ATSTCTLSLHDALPISHRAARSPSVRRAAQVTARSMPATVAGNCSVAIVSPVAATRMARVSTGVGIHANDERVGMGDDSHGEWRSEEHTSELQSRFDLV